MTSCTGTEREAREIEARTSGAVESMEGAAVAHVAHLHGIRVGEVRGISNMVTDRDTSAWRVKEAAVAAQEAVLSWIAAPLNFAFSSCPNDTFAFHALVHGLVPGPRVFLTSTMWSAQRARRTGRRGSHENFDRGVPTDSRSVCAAALRAAPPDSAWAPIVVARTPRAVGGRVAIPGERTTAALLLHLLGNFERVPMRFDQIEDAVLRGDVDCGVLIHEGRFTYQAKGLALLADLARCGRNACSARFPLAAIAIRRDLAAAWGHDVDRALRSSVAHAFAHPEASRDYVASHAQEMDPSVVAKHIGLYVNDYTLALDEAAVHVLLDWSRQHANERTRVTSQPIFV